MFTQSVRHQDYLMKVIFYGPICSAIGRTVIRQGSVSYGLVLMGCGLLVVYIFLYYFLHYYQSASVLNTND